MSPQEIRGNKAVAHLKRYLRGSRAIRSVFLEMRRPKTAITVIDLKKIRNAGL